MSDDPDQRFIEDLGLEEQSAVRLEKLRRIQAEGGDPYPARVQRSHTAAQALALWSELSVAGLDEHGAPLGDNPTLQLTGRVVLWRVMGKAAFATIEDGSGRIQLYFKRDVLGEEQYQRLRRDLDLGDFLSATGDLFLTRSGEITLRVTAHAIIAKSLHPLPDKWHGLSDTEKRYRQRYVDLLANPESRQVARTRSRMVTLMRRFLDERGYLEVETPVLQPIYGGGAAVPFTTHYRALDQTFYLRIADELYLKRLLVGGFERVYEFSRDFRNEGADATHAPEFTMLELYETYASYETMMTLFEEMCVGLALELHGRLQFEYDGNLLDFTPPWRRVDMRDALIEHAGIDFNEYPDTEAGRHALYEAARKAGIHVEPEMRWAKLLDEVLAATVEPGFISPTFLVGHPVLLSPLAKRRPDDPQRTERFEAYMGGFEMANAFSELNDPTDQYARFVAAGRDAAAGDEEAHRMDVDFLTALAYGMPPTGGMGIGIDRLAMIFTGQTNIRDVILFPQLRSK
jgi:lysyl-tRNA synthetase, class II